MSKRKYSCKYALSCYEDKCIGKKELSTQNKIPKKCKIYGAKIESLPMEHTGREINRPTQNPKEYTTYPDKKRGRIERGDIG